MLDAVPLPDVPTLALPPTLHFTVTLYPYPLPDRVSHSRRRRERFPLPRDAATISAMIAKQLPGVTHRCRAKRSYDSRELGLCYTLSRMLQHNIVRRTDNQSRITHSEYRARHCSSRWVSV